MHNHFISSAAVAILLRFFYPTSAFTRTSAANQESPRLPCLTSTETHSIASQFVLLFNTNSTGQVPTGATLPLSLLTPDYIDYDGDAVVCQTPENPNRHFVGSDRPPFDNRDVVIAATEYAGKEILKFVYREYEAKVLHAFASCDEIAIRYEGSARATANRRGVTVPGGTPVKWRGTSLLKVDLESRKVEMAESSEDRLTIYTQLGIKNIDDLLSDK